MHPPSPHYYHKKAIKTEMQWKTYSLPILDPPNDINMNFFDDFEDTAEDVHMAASTNNHNNDKKNLTTPQPKAQDKYEENKRKRQLEMKQPAPAHYAENLTALNPKYYNETRINQSYYLRAMVDVASSGIQLIKANYKTHDFKHSNDLLGNIISFHDEDLDYTVNSWSQLLKYHTMWLRTCEGKVNKFQTKIEERYKQVYSEKPTHVKSIHLLATSDKVYPVVAKVDYGSDWISENDIIVCFTKIARTNKKAKMNQYENYAVDNDEDQSEEKPSWCYIAGSQSVRMPLRFVPDLVHAGQRVLMDSLLSSVVPTNNTFEDKVDVKRILIKMLRRIHEIYKKPVNVLKDEDKKIVGIVEKLNFKLSPSLLGDLMSQLAKLTFPRWANVGEEAKAMELQDMLRQSRLRGHLISLIVDRPAFMIALFKLEVALSTINKPIEFNKPVDDA